MSEQNEYYLQEISTLKQEVEALKENLRICKNNLSMREHQLSMETQYSCFVAKQLPLYAMNHIDRMWFKSEERQAILDTFNTSQEACNQRKEDTLSDGSDCINVNNYERDELVRGLEDE